MKDETRKKLLQALLDKQVEAILSDAHALSKFIEKKDNEHRAFWKGYRTGMRDSKEVVREFEKPTEEVLG